MERMLTEKQIERFKEVLEEEQKKLAIEVEKKEIPTEFGDETGNFDSDADEAEELENELSVGDTLRERLTQVEEALARIEAGTYGICEECGRIIEDKVLEAAPESILCAEDKKGHI
jgi:DnaK suppressor protein